MGLCESCKNNSCGYASEDVIRCGDFEGNFLQTNADSIRAMSDEELAEVLGKLVHCGACPMRDNCKVDNLPCNNVLIEWLKQPAKGE